ncbi:MAG: intradiol ring-cleavage dioxygenase [Ignavibacteriaceae bacterium]
MYTACGKENISKTEILKDTCDGPDANISCCFINMPDYISEIMKIAGESEEGQRMIIKGQILNEDEKTPYPGILIYAYHTDNNGYYSKKGNEKGIQKWHGYLHGWCRTNEEGRYEIHSIKPNRYPSNNAPAHIHWAIKKTDGEMSYLNDFVFSNDSLVNDEYLSYLRSPGDNGVIDLNDNGSGVLTGSRTTILK